MARLNTIEKIKLLSNSLDYIEARVPEGKFRMQSWHEDLEFNGGQPSTFAGMKASRTVWEDNWKDPKCGTAGCFAGWSFTDPAVQQSLVNDIMARMPRMPTDDAEREAMNWYAPEHLQDWVARDAPFDGDQVYEAIFQADFSYNVIDENLREEKEDYENASKEVIVERIRDGLQDLYERAGGEGKLTTTIKEEKKQHESEAA